MFRRNYYLLLGGSHPLLPHPSLKILWPPLTRTLKTLKVRKGKSLIQE